MPRRHPFPCIGELASELARSAWEASLPDVDSPIHVLTVSGGELSKESFKRLNELMKTITLGGSKKPFVALIEGMPASVGLEQVEGIKFGVTKTSISPEPLLEEYLSSLP